MDGELRIVDDVPLAFSTLVLAEYASSAPMRGGRPFRLVASGGSSGAACFGAVATSGLELSDVELYFADERCVDATTPESNQFAIEAVLGAARERLAGFFPMSCVDGASRYEQRLKDAGRLDLIQLGLGPDGHTASLFPKSRALDLPADQLVAINTDPSGTNVHDRMTLTYGGIELGALVIVTVIGSARAKVVRAIVDGADYPASRLHAARVIWLVDTAAASLLEGDIP